MKTADFIREHKACSEGAEWALSISKNMSDVWDAMIEQNRHEWLLWTATRPGVFPDSTLRRLACRFIRETPVGGGKTVWDLLDDARSRNAVEVAEAYADGKATEAELDAAYAAARAAYYAAYSAAARAACDAYDSARAAAWAAAWAAARSAAWAAAWAADAGCFATEAARATADADLAAARATARAARSAARSAHAKMITELGNPFKKGE